MPGVRRRGILAGSEAEWPEYPRSGLWRPRQRSSQPKDPPSGGFL